MASKRDLGFYTSLPAIVVICFLALALFMHESFTPHSWAISFAVSAAANLGCLVFACLGRLAPKATRQN